MESKNQNNWFTTTELDNLQALNVNGYYQIKNRYSCKLLDVSGVSTADGANIQQWTANGGADQLFSILAT